MKVGGRTAIYHAQPITIRKSLALHGQPQKGTAKFHHRLMGSEWRGEQAQAQQGTTRHGGECQYGLPTHRRHHPKESHGMAELKPRLRKRTRLLLGGGLRTPSIPPPSSPAVLKVGGELLASPEMHPPKDGPLPHRVAQKRGGGGAPSLFRKSVKVTRPQPQ